MDHIGKPPWASEKRRRTVRYSPDARFTTKGGGHALQVVADIYFTEFNRLFNHYYFRAVQESLQGQPVSEANLFLDETGKQWVKKYAPGKLRAKRLQLYTTMKRTVTL